VVPELNYSPYAKYPAKGEKSSSKNWRIDLVLFVNGIPVANNAVRQYCRDCLPKDPVTGKPEPLLTFKRGALVHFAVSQYDVQMCTRLAGSESFFLPFNRGAEDGGAGNDVPKDGSHPTSFLWREILQRDHFLGIIGRFVHLQIEEKEDWQGKRVKSDLVSILSKQTVISLERLSGSFTTQTRSSPAIPLRVGLEWLTCSGHSKFYPPRVPHFSLFWLTRLVNGFRTMKYKFTSSVVLALSASLTLVTPSFAAITLQDGIPYTQDFNSMPSSGVNHRNLPDGWQFSESGAGENVVYQVDRGDATVGDTYSYGANLNKSDRALGILRNAYNSSTIGASFTNSVGASTIDITISYTGEEWRLGSAGGTDRLDFQYSTDATSLKNGSWLEFDSLDFVAPNTTDPFGMVNGNADENRTVVSGTIASLVVANGATFWIRWNDFEAANANYGLAVDDFSITAVPEPSTALLCALGVFGIVRRRR
jgi:hypothetical protein